MSDILVKRQLSDAKKLRDELVERLSKNPWDSETAMHIIGMNKVIAHCWHNLGNEAKYEEGMSPWM